MAYGPTFQITIKTGDEQEAATDARVYLRLIDYDEVGDGSTTTTNEILFDLKGEHFDRSSIKSQALTFDKRLNNIKEVEVRIESVDPTTSWQLDWIHLDDPTDDPKHNTIWYTKPGLWFENQKDTSKQHILMQAMCVNEYMTRMVVGKDGGSGAVALRILGETQLSDLPWQDIESDSPDFAAHSSLVYGSYIYPIAPEDVPTELEVRVQYAKPEDTLFLSWIGIENLKTQKKYVAEINQSLLKTKTFPLIEREY